MILFLWISSSVADIAAYNSNGNKSLLGSGVNTTFINDKPAVINGLRKFKNPSYRRGIFVVVPFNKVFLFSKDFITFITYFISLFPWVIPKPVIDKIFKLFTNYITFCI